ncbi:60S ribosomal protein L32 [Tupaia chinensis]|uniref:60S ribosomal protein L32 n=1 Tax=Tupaia chinensis TaxID=246437 RepID=L9L056_TUPCH|nr:60S ribosomal protein L32 [Tupaia chinensis]
MAKLGHMPLTSHSPSNGAGSSRSPASPRLPYCSRTVRSSSIFGPGSLLRPVCLEHLSQGTAGPSVKRGPALPSSSRPAAVLVLSAEASVVLSLVDLLIPSLCMPSVGTRVWAPSRDAEPRRPSGRPARSDRCYRWEKGEDGARAQPLTGQGAKPSPCGVGDGSFGLASSARSSQVQRRQSVEVAAFPTGHQGCLRPLVKPKNLKRTKEFIWHQSDHYIKVKAQEVLLTCRQSYCAEASCNVSSKNLNAIVERAARLAFSRQSQHQLYSEEDE